MDAATVARELLGLANRIKGSAELAAAISFIERAIVECMNNSKVMTTYTLKPNTGVKYVVLSHDHKTLKAGDVIVVSETASFENVLVRASDLTVHAMTTANDEYTIVRPA